MSIQLLIYINQSIGEKEVKSLHPSVAFPWLIILLVPVVSLALSCQLIKDEVRMELVRGSIIHKINNEQLFQVKRLNGILFEVQCSKLNVTKKRVRNILICITKSFILTTITSPVPSG